MRKILISGVSVSCTLAALAAAPAAQAGPVFSFSTGPVTNQIATASRPSTPGKIETESADDFILGSATAITHATFTGLLPIGTPLSDIGNVRVEIYRVFPKDSTVPPSGNVPTRVNSPSDIAFAERDVASSTLSFSSSLLSPSVTANNSIVNGINKIPNQTTGGDGLATGQEVVFGVTLTSPIDLPADHYFFVPQVESTGSGDFLWLSATRPIVAPGTPFAPDLQAWIRNENLAPDWLREGTDIVGGVTFNQAFSLDGTPIPEPASLVVLTGLVGTLLLRRRSRPPTSPRSGVTEGQ